MGKGFASLPKQFCHSGRVSQCICEDHFEFDSILCPKSLYFSDVLVGLMSSFYRKLVNWMCGSSEQEIETARPHHLTRLGYVPPPSAVGPLNFEQALAYARQKAQQGTNSEPTPVTSAIPPAIPSMPPGYPPAIPPPGFRPPHMSAYPPPQPHLAQQQYPPSSMYMPMGYGQPPPPRPPANLYNPAVNAVAAAQQQSIYNNIVNYAAQNAQTSGLSLPVPPVDLSV